MASRNEVYVNVPKDKLYSLAEQAIFEGDEKLANELMDQIDGVDFDFGEAASNLPSSAVKYGVDMAEGIASMSPFSPSEGFRVPPALDSLGILASGAAQNLGLTDGKFRQLGLDPNSAKLADAVGDHYSDRYGSWDNIKRTAMDDPVGVLSDLSMPFTGGATLLASATKSMAKTNKLANALKTGSQVLDPIGAFQVATAKPLYKTGARPTVAREVDRTGDVERILDKAFDNEIPIKQKGVDKVNDIIESDMARRSEILEGIPGEYSVGHALTPRDKFLSEILDPDSGTRGDLDLDTTAKKITDLTDKEYADASTKGLTRSASGLNAMKTRQMKVANSLKAYNPDSNKNVEALTHRDIGTKIKENLEGLAENQTVGGGDELRAINENYGDMSALGRALDNKVGSNQPKFNIDYSVRSGAGAMGATPGQAVTLGSLVGNTAGDTAAALGLALKPGPKKQALVQVLRQSGMNEQQIEDELQRIGEL